MSEAVLQGLKTYASRRHNTSTQFIATRSIMDLCLAAKRKPGSRITKGWWEQYGMNVEWMRTAAQVAERTEGGGGTY